MCGLASISCCYAGLFMEVKFQVWGTLSLPSLLYGIEKNEKWQVVRANYINSQYTNTSQVAILHKKYMRLWYWIYLTGFTMACVSWIKHSSEFKEIIIKILRDLLNMPWLDAIEMLVGNFLWPFRKMGVFGLVFGVIYWPIVMPFSIFACLCYCIPLLFVSLRLMTHALKLSSRDDDRKMNIPLGEDCHCLGVMGPFSIFFNILWNNYRSSSCELVLSSSCLMGFRWAETKKCHANGASGTRCEETWAWSVWSITASLGVNQTLECYGLSLTPPQHYYASPLYWLSWYYSQNALLMCYR